MRLILATILAGMATPALAQMAPAASRAYERAPWWMDKPIIASTGAVSADLPANRASVEVTYDAVDRELAEATKAAAGKARSVASSLTSYGVEKVQVATRLAVEPLYEQYRNKQGELVDNERADKVDRYQVSVHVTVNIRDVRLVEPVYALLVAGKPTKIGAVDFSLDQSNEGKTLMFKQAVEDARRRAELATAASGAHLGAVKLIDPTGRACETDVLVAGAPRDEMNPVMAAVPAPPLQARPAVEEMIVTAQKKAAAAGLNPQDLQLPIQPPLEKAEASVCVVFALSAP